MSASLYYSAKYPGPLPEKIEKEFEWKIGLSNMAVENQITGENLDKWESFFYEIKTETNSKGDITTIFSGSTKLPNGQENSIWKGLQFWSKLLNKLRNLIPTADWDVSVDHHQLVWDEKTNSYDLQK